MPGCQPATGILGGVPPPWDLWLSISRVDPFENAQYPSPSCAVTREGVFSPCFCVFRKKAEHFMQFFGGLKRWASPH